MRPTLAGRLSLLGTAAAAFWVLAITVIFNVLVDERLGNEVDSLVVGRAQAAAATVRVDDTGTLSVLPGEDDVLDVNVWIYAGDRLIEGAPNGLSRKVLPQLLSVGDVVLNVEGSAATRYGAVAIRDVRGRQVGTVVAAAPLLPFAGARRDIVAASAGLALLTLVGTYLALRLSVVRAIAPVTRMTEQAAAWSAQGSGNRFGDSSPYAELDTLGHNLDSLLARLSALLLHEQRLTAELSHELRTPLSTLRAELELLAMRPRDPVDVQATAGGLLGSVDRLTAIIDTLVMAARHDIDATPGVWPLAPILDSVLSALLPPGAATEVHVCVDPPDLTVGAPAEIVERALSPVIENALRFAATSVAVTASVRGPETVITVVNDGPGLPDHDVFAPLRERDAPADPGGHPGAGLGMPLARRLAIALGGEVRPVPMDRGAAFEVRLPRGDA